MVPSRTRARVPSLPETRLPAPQALSSPKATTLPTLLPPLPSAHPLQPQSLSHRRLHCLATFPTSRRDPLAPTPRNLNATAMARTTKTFSSRANSTTLPTLSGSSPTPQPSGSDTKKSRCLRRSHRPSATKSVGRTGVLLPMVSWISGRPRPSSSCSSSLPHCAHFFLPVRRELTWVRWDSPASNSRWPRSVRKKCCLLLFR